MPGRMSDLDNCPYCGTPLTGFECWNCKVEFVYDAGADKLVERGRSERSDRRRVGCGVPLKHSSVLTEAWEDGDNPDAYITCADCGCQNIV